MEMLQKLSHFDNAIRVKPIRGFVQNKECGIIEKRDS